MKKTLIAIAAAVSLISGCGYINTQNQNISNIVLMSRKEAKLYTAEMQMRGYITYTSVDILRILGNETLKYGKRTIYIPVAIPARAYIDFQRISEDNFRTTGNKITVTLPQPEIEYGPGRVDGECSEHADIGCSFSAEERIKLTKSAIAQYKTMEKEAGEYLMEEARISAKKTMISMLEGMGYREQDIEILYELKIEIKKD